MRRAVLAALLSLLAAPALADANGRWATQPGETGGHLVVEIAPCGGNLCGTIVEARKASGEADPAYAHLGKRLIADMAPDGADKWSGGTIWDPEEDKTYKSGMELKSPDVLGVEGCVLVFCRNYDWKRVK